MRTSAYYQDDFTLKEKLQYAAIGLLLIGGSFVIGRNIVRKARATSEEKKTYDDSNAAYYAQKLKIAFENDNYFGWGTDEEGVRQVLRKIPTKNEFKKVIASYQKLYAKSLMLDLKEELTASEYNEMLAIIAGKPDSITDSASSIGEHQYRSWAQRLGAAFETSYWFIPGTDETAIKTVFMEIPTQADFKKVAQAYQNEYGSDLMTDLKTELEFWEYGSMMAIINQKPKA